MKAARLSWVGSDLSGVSVSAWYHWSGQISSMIAGTATDGLWKQIWSLPPHRRLDGKAEGVEGAVLDHRDGESTACRGGRAASGVKMMSFDRQT